MVRARSLLVVLPLLSAGLGCAEVIHGNGTVRDEERTVPSFSKVEVRASLATEIVKADEAGVRLKADENLLGLLVARVEGDTLVLAIAEDDVVLEPTATMTAIVSTTDLSSVEALADEPVNLSGWAVASLALGSRGAGGVSATDLDVGDLAVESSGAGNVTLGGDAEVLRLDSSGAGGVDASALLAGRIEVDSSGAGEVAVQTDGTVDGTLSGSGDLVVTGDPSRIDVEDMGSGGVSIR
jgi:Putative auto-transporter adhesin, head GIN domain